MIELKPATKFIKPMKIFIYGPSYAGKTYSALKMAAGIVMSIRKCTEQEAYKHVILIDSEYGRGALHKALGPYNYFEIKPPYYTHKLVQAIDELNVMDQIDVVITDSLTHFWAKDGGVLEQKAKKDSAGGNSYTNWIEFTGVFNKMVDAIMQSPKHIIATSRSKNDTILEADSRGKMVPHVYGLKPELRDGIEFDFDITFNIDKASHDLIMEKGVPGMDPIYPAATPDLGEKLLDLFNADAVVKERSRADIEESIRRTTKDNNLVQFVQLKLSGRKLDAISIEELKALEQDLANEIVNKQTKK